MSFRKPQKPAPKTPKVWPFWDPPTAKPGPKRELDEVEEAFVAEVTSRLWLKDIAGVVGATIPLVMVIVIVVLTFITTKRCAAEGQQECRDRGGVVAEVHGGRGGWICQERAR